MSKQLNPGTELLTAHKELSAEELDKVERQREAKRKLRELITSSIVQGSYFSAPKRSWDRIAERLDELFPVIDELEKSLTTHEQQVNFHCLLVGFTALLRSVVGPVGHAKLRNYGSSIGKRNDTQQALAVRAAEIARDLWADDLKKQIMLGRMAEQVLDRLLEELENVKIEGHLNQDGDLQSVRKWIRPEAPEHALKRGRPKGAKDAH